MRTRSRRTALTLFAAGILVASVARADNLYYLSVYCEGTRNPTVILGLHVVNPGAGSIFLCAGMCGGKMVQIADVLAGLPAEVSAGLTAEVEKHEANAAAGRGESLTTCRGRTPPPAPPGADDCKKNPTVPGFVYSVAQLPAGGDPNIRGGNVRVRVEPRRDSNDIGTVPNGGRLLYREVRKVNGKTWYYVQVPGSRSAMGWVDQKETTCIRPQNPPALQPIWSNPGKSAFSPGFRAITYCGCGMRG